MTEVAIKGEVHPSIKSIKKLAYDCYRNGMTYEGYSEHLTKKIELENKHFEKFGTNTNKVYRYKDLTMEDIEFLKNNYKRLKLHYDNLSTKKYNDILFKKKQLKNYNKKKNDIIETFRIQKLSELDSLRNHKFLEGEKYSCWANVHNVLYQYNRVVPGVHSKESLREYVMSH